MPGLYDRKKVLGFGCLFGTRTDILTISLLIHSGDKKWQPIQGAIKNISYWHLLNTEEKPIQDSISKLETFNCTLHTSNF